MGSGPMLVRSMYKTADDRSEGIKGIFCLETYGTLKGGKGRVERLFLLHSFLQTLRMLDLAKCYHHLKEMVRYNIVGWDTFSPKP